MVDFDLAPPTTEEFENASQMLAVITGVIAWDMSLVFIVLILCA